MKFMLRRYWGWLALAVVVGLVLIPLLRGTFGLFGAVMDIALIMIVAISVLYVLFLKQREGLGPATENKEDLMITARKTLKQDKITREEYKRIKENIDD